MELFALVIVAALLATLPLMAWLRESRCKRCGGRFAWRKTGAQRERSGFWVGWNVEVEYRCRHCGAVRWEKKPKGPTPWLSGSGFG
ncbi:hypothetical protein [uncultured Thiohalocapsa sp.]|uniref:hypothetical protein n=1 Tax=uncultured Thiohalocapsa sp. TaxID=768990 RepID=UPI0025E00E76|nr:hypothetical protein [uncultured Thiohalocapsa sp.]